MSRSVNCPLASLTLVLPLFLCTLALANEPAAKNSKPAAKTEKNATSDSKTNSKTEKNVTSDSKKTAELPKKEEPPTYTVKKTPFKIVVELDGVFEARKMYEIAVRPDEWSMLVVDSAVPHGAKVRKGDVLLSLDTEKIDLLIADLRTDLKISEIAVRQGEDQLQALEKTTPFDMDAAKRAARIAEEDRKYFIDVDRPFALKLTDFSLKMAEQTLEYEQEELRQLEKMYKSDDITEETEQIVLKRARDTVEKAKFSLEYVKLSRDQALKFAIPRVGEQVEDAARRKSVDWEKNKIELPLILQKQRLELEKSRAQRQRADEKLKRLLADRETLTVKSPADGLVYYGKCTRGRFGDSTGAAENLRRNGAIAPNQIVMTVVEPRPMFVRAMVPEAKLHYLRPNMTGVAAPNGYPDLKLPVTLDTISDIPVGPGNFDSRFDLTLNRRSKFLMPGMTCDIKLTPYLKKDALCVPAKAVITDELDEEKHFVHVLNKDGKPEKRPVTIGEKDGKQIEILKGLSVGEKVLLEPPKEQ